MSSLVTEKKITRKKLKTKITTQMTHLRNTAIRIHRNKLPYNERQKLGDSMQKKGEGFFNMDELNNALNELGYKDERDDEEKDHEKQQLERIAQMIETLENDWFKYNDDGEWPENTEAEDRIDDPENWSGGVGNWQEQIQAIHDHYEMDTHGINGKVHFVVQGVLNGNFKTNQELEAEQKACKREAAEKQRAYCQALREKQEAKKKAHAEHLKKAEAKDRKEAEDRGDINMKSSDWRKELYNKKREEAKKKAQESSSEYFSSEEDEEELTLKWLEIPSGLQDIFGNEKILVDAEGDIDNIYDEEGTITGNITELMTTKGGWKTITKEKHKGKFYFGKSGHKSLWATKGGKGVFPIYSLLDGMKKPAAQGGKRKTRKRKRKRRRKNTKKKRKRKRTKKKRKRKRRKTRK